MLMTLGDIITDGQTDKPETANTVLWFSAQQGTSYISSLYTSFAKFLMLIRNR